MSKKSVRAGNLQIGGGAPISIQSMTNCDPHDAKTLIEQVMNLKNAGCEAVRLTVPDAEAAETFAKVKRTIDIPLIADIHFDYKMALLAIKAGADKIRINPGNIGGKDRVLQVVKAAKDAGIPIRVGVNSGSLEKDILTRNGGVTAEGLCESALRNLEIIEDMGFDDLVISLKSSDVRMNFEAHKLVAAKTEHPIHIGITEAGTMRRGKVKSAVGIGSLLLLGIGDTMRVSLTADPVEEVYFAREILETIGLRKPKYDIVSCPTCGRTMIDLEKLVGEVERRIEKEELRTGIKLAVMGCVVNGPGEAGGADYGIAGGNGKGVIFAGGKIVKTVSEEKLVDELFAVIRENEGQ